MMQTNCFICQSSQHFLYQWRSFNLYRCELCGTESVAPLPTAEELELFYQKISAKKIVRWQHCLKQVERALAGYLNFYYQATGQNKPDKFLDLGGGVGYYAKAALKRKIDTCLMDWANDALEFARTTLEIPFTVQGNIQKSAEFLPSKSFDFVLSRHSIEHMLDPQEFLQNIGRVMRQRGLLQIETPNVLSKEQFGHPGVIVENYKILKEGNPSLPRLTVTQKAFSKSMSGINPPKHLWGFTAKGLGLLLENNGFEILSVKQAQAGHFIYDPLYYEYHRLSTKKGLGIPYYFWEKSSSIFFKDRGMNLAILARFTT